MRRSILVCLAVAGLAVAEPAAAGPSFAAIFSDHAVLQRGTPVHVWGFSAPDESLILTAGSRRMQVTADAAGRWRASLPPLSLGPAFSMTIAGADGEATINDVVAGDVWLCAGQSNMQYPLRQAELDGDVAAPEGDIRYVTVPRESRVTPSPDFSEAVSWTKADTDRSRTVSAACYFMGETLHRREHVPVGLISASWGGSWIEAWLPAAALRDGPHAADLPYLQVYARDPTAAEAAWQRDVDPSWRPSADTEGWDAKPDLTGRQPPWVDRKGLTTIYNGMIVPLATYTLSGVAWYQGESNVTAPDIYETQLGRLRSSWRRLFGQPALPFVIVQLPGFGRMDADRGGWAEIREAQRDAAIADPHSAYVVTLDLGDPDMIHPPHKAEVGRRLARAAEHLVYHRSLAPSGPRPLAAREAGNDVVVSFADTRGGLRLRGEPPRTFEACGLDDRCRPVDGRVEGDRLILENAGAATSVRYAFMEAPMAVLYGGDGMPAPTFELKVGS